MALRIRSTQRGATLLVALVVLVAVTLLALSSLRMSLAGLRAAVNEELRIDAFQAAQSLIDAALAVPANTAVAGKVGDTNCLPGIPGCTRNDVTLAAADEAAELEAENGEISLVMRRVAPEFGLPPRSAGYSTVRFRAANVQVESEFDQTQKGWGRDRLNEGVAVIVPSPGL